MTDTTALALGPEMTIVHAAALRDTLVDAVAASDGPLLLDLRSVDEFDSSGVQILLAVRRSLAAEDRPLRIAGLSPAVRDALAVFGLDGAFDGARGAD